MMKREGKNYAKKLKQYIVKTCYYDPTRPDQTGHSIFDQGK